MTRERHGKPESVDQFRVYGNQELGSGAMGVRPGNILVAVRDPRNLYYLRHVLGHTNTDQAGCCGHERPPLPSRAQFQRQCRL